MPETPEQLHARAAGALRTPSVETWETWPFEGSPRPRPRPLTAPAERERPRMGEGGVDCWACTAGDDAYVWTTERWRLRPIDPPTGLPVHVGRWGEGGEHLHWWFLARPARMPQLASSFAAIWDDILPPTPDHIWRENITAVVAALGD